jgi:glycosyltransferase A (GT-A) superfamily protein (DUF2064 family)
MNGSGRDVSTLVVFCRRPAPGVGKRRIAATAGAERALALGEHLLAAALEDAAAWPGPVVLAPAAAADTGWAATLLARDATVHAQGDGNLGERLGQVDAALRSAGHARLVFVGSDAPLLDHTYYARARRALDHADVVLGPAADGGVTLMGARVPWPDLADLPWGSAGLGAALDRRCRARGLGVHELDLQYDVDEAAILPRLYRDLARDARPARRALRQWLDTHAPELIVAPPGSDGR